MANRYSTQVAPGIHTTPTGFRAFVWVDGIQKSKRFPAATSIQTIEQWRQKTRSVRLRELVWRHDPTRAWKRRGDPYLPRTLNGWCYLYVIAGDNAVKIGRATDPLRRLKELRAGHDSELELLTAVPIHASLEPVIHERLAAHRRAGEWYAVTHEIVRFIEEISLGLNPALWVWNYTKP